MTAPAAPFLNARQYGGKLRLHWRPVDNATDYNVYIGDMTAPTGLEDSVNYTEAEANGWFTWWSGIQIGQVFVRITALNALAEESAKSNERQLYITSDSDDSHAPPDESLLIQMERGFR